MPPVNFELNCRMRIANDEERTSSRVPDTRTVRDPACPLPMCVATTYANQCEIISDSRCSQNWKINERHWTGANRTPRVSKKKYRMSILANRTSGISCVFERAKLRSCASKAALIFLSVSPNRHRQIWCSHTCIDRSTRNFSVVIYVLGGFEPRRKAAFEIVEVVGVLP